MRKIQNEKGERKMTQVKRMALFAAAALLIFLSGPATQDSPQPTPQQAPASPEAPAPPGDNFGVLPPPVDMSHIGAEGFKLVGAPPVSWDWRVNNGVTPVKNQASCGSCWDFAATGALESLVRIRSGKILDLSEQNMLECNTWGHGCGGGHAWSATSYFTTKGTVLEACDPYQAIKTGNCNTSCAKIKQVTGWKIIPNDVSAIKAAVYQYGPCYTTMYASFPGFSGYDGSYCLYYTGTETINHAVLIVGWDDNMAHAGGTGAWIVKNSWGMGWGAGGYFYIAYGSARIGTSTCCYSDYKHYDYLEMMGTLYHYDEGGWVTNRGYGNTTAWGLVKFIPAKDDCIHAVDFWAVDDNMTYEIYIYDTFDGTATSGLLHSQSGSCPEAGYYSIPLTSPVWVKKGNDFAVAVKFVCSGYNYPVPSDTFSPIETGKCYLSSSGASGSWTDLSGNGDDISIRARGKNHQFVFDGSDFNNDVASDISVWRPASGRWFFYGGSSQAWGDEGDIPVNGDYNGDRRTDVAVWRPADGYWYVSGGAVTPWGTRGDIPVPGDYNGSLTTDLAVWRPSDGYWYINGIGNYQWGQAGDIPVPGDYDGNGTTDRAVWRPSDGVWYVSGGSPVQWGAIGDIPVPADYDGDTKVDIAVWRPSNGVWYIKYAAGGTASLQWGTAGDVPAPGDFNGNAAFEMAVWRPSNGVWYVNGGSVYQWGQSGDIPLVR
jgi:C1A family cysteine protease